MAPSKTIFSRNHSFLRSGNKGMLKSLLKKGSVPKNSKRRKILFTLSRQKKSGAGFR